MDGPANTFEQMSRFASWSGDDADLEGVGWMAQTTLKISAPTMSVSTEKRIKTDSNPAPPASPAESRSPDANVKPWIDHLEKHNARDAKSSVGCSKCIYARNCGTWRKMTEIKALSSPWLSPRPASTVDADWGIGCLVCHWAQGRKPDSDGGGSPGRHAYAFSTVVGSAMRITNLKRHARSADQAGRQVQNDDLCRCAVAGGIQ